MKASTFSNAFFESSFVACETKSLNVGSGESPMYVCVTRRKLLKVLCDAAKGGGGAENFWQATSAL